MAQLGLAVVGSVVGAATGLPFGAQIGWTLGAMLGSSMAPATQGPRLSDLTVQVSSYGSPLADIWGTMAVAGNVVWASDLVETESQQGGKGGPSYTSYSYAANFAVAIGEGEIAGIRRIWLNAKLVYDVRDGVSDETKTASADFAQFFTFYTGSEDQLPDPTIESYEGAGNVEPMRGTAYIVFTNLALGNYANMIPQVHVEVIPSEVQDITVEYLAPLTIRAWEQALGSNGQLYLRHSQGGRTQYQIANPVSGDVSSTTENYEQALALVLGSGYTTYYGYSTWTQYRLDTFGQGTDILNGYGPVGAQMNYHIQTFATPLWLGDAVLGNSSSNYLLCAYGLPLGKDFLISSIQKGYEGYGASNLTLAGLACILPHGVTRVGYEMGVNNCTDYPADGGGYFPTAWIGKFYEIWATRIPSVPPSLCGPGDPQELGIAELPGDPNYCLSSDGTLSRNVVYEEITGSWLQLQAANPINTGPTSYITEPGMGPIMLASDPRNTQAFWDQAAADAGLSGSYGIDYPDTVTKAGHASVTTKSAADQTVLLSTIVTDICERAGLSAGQIDVTALTDEVIGYARAKVMAARSALEPLRQAYAFDAVESGDIIKFVKRGGAAAATISLDDMGCAEDKGLPAPLDHARIQESELPVSVIVTYPSYAADYEPATQQARRMFSASQQETGAEMPVVLSDQKAAEIAFTLLYDAWVGRNSRTVALPLKWAHIEPTDVVNLDDGEFEYRTRVGDKTEQNGIATLVCQDDDAIAYSPEVVASAAHGGGAVVSFVLPTNLTPLDIPIVRDVDNDGAGFYAAVSRYGGKWNGSHIYRSTDGGSNYTYLTDATTEATIGTAITVLGDFGGGNVVDELNSVRVQLISGSLSSITRAQLLQGQNLILLGNELLQFRNAVIVSASTYDLTGLLRGRFGTERYKGAHVNGEKFILMNEATIKRVPEAVDYVNVPSILKAVAFGSTLSASYAVNFTNTGEGAKPYSPVHLNVTRTVSGHYAVKWIRRSRMAPAWKDLGDAPVNETVEVYDLELTEPGGAILFTDRITGVTQYDLAAVGSSATFSASPFFKIQDSGSGLIALTADPSGKSIYSFDSSYAFLGGAGYGAGYDRAIELIAVGSDDIYAATQAYSDPSYVRKYSKASIEGTALLTPTASYMATLAADIYGMAFDGTYIWTAENYSGRIRKLDLSTLAVLASYTMVARGIEYDSVTGHLFVDSGDRVSEINPAGSPVLIKEIVTGGSASHGYPGAGALFVFGPGGLLVYNIATGLLLTAHSSVAFNSFAPPIIKTSLGMAVACPATNDILIMDPSTGEELYRLALNGVQYLAGYSAAAGTLFAIVGIGAEMKTYALVNTSIASGTILKVYQLSSIVGRGHPASYTFP